MGKKQVETATKIHSSSIFSGMKLTASPCKVHVVIFEMTLILNKRIPLAFLALH